MAAATASMADVSGTGRSKKDAGRVRNKPGRAQPQCAPMPLPALGTQKIVQGNGTNVGTIISLQCPDKHKLVGSELKCVLATNSTHWVGETYCKPLSPFEDHGFRVAVLASIVSLAIIFIMSIAFITCCLLDCIEKERRKEQERESDLWQRAEQAQHREDAAHHSHKGRNNNNNTQQETLPRWDAQGPATWERPPACRCQGDFARGPACTSGSSSSFAALPGQDYVQPLLLRSPEPVVSRQTTSQTSATGPGLPQDGEQPSRLSPTDANTRNKNPVKDFSIRIISV